MRRLAPPFLTLIVALLALAPGAYADTPSDLTLQLFKNELKIPDGSIAFADPLPSGHTIHEVDRDNDNGWKIHVTSGRVSFEQDRCNPAMTPLGTGALHVQVFASIVAPLTFARLRSTRYHRTYLRDLTRLDYWACEVRNQGQQWPFLVLEIDYTGDNKIDDELIFEPAYQSDDGGVCGLTESMQDEPAYNIWQFWDGLRGAPGDPTTFKACWWSVENFALFPAGVLIRPLRDYIAMFPNAAIVNLDGNHGGVQLMHGFSSPSDEYDGWFDAFTIGKDINNTSGQSTNSTITYDYECNDEDDPSCRTT